MKNLRDVIQEGILDVNLDKTTTDVQITQEVRKLIYKYFAKYTHYFTDEGKDIQNAYFKTTRHVWNPRVGNANSFMKKVRMFVTDLKLIPGIKLDIDEYGEKYTIKLTNYPRSQGSPVEYPTIVIGMKMGYNTKAIMAFEEMFMDV